MKKKSFVRIVSAILTTSLMAAASPIAAATTDDANEITAEYEGGLNTVVITDDSVLDNAISVSPSDGSSKVSTYAKKSSSSLTGWYRYTNYYVYNRLSTYQKMYWDELDEICYEVLTGSEDVTDYITEQRNKYYYLTPLECNYLSYSELADLIMLFQASNPQYYFISSIMVSDSDKSVVGVGIYSDFASAAARSSATSSLSSSLSAALSSIEGNTTGEIVKSIHDYVCANADYVSDPRMNAGSSSFVAADESYYTQGMYSALVTGQTVCAGYSEAFEALCNAVGIRTIAVTSEEHEWNKVYVDGYWYIVDTTWDDTSSDTHTVYTYYARSDAAISSLDTDGYHNQSSEWSQIAPSASYDTGSSESKAGAFATVSSLVSSPVITENNGVITITSNDGADTIYYTIDGSLPSASETKSLIYTGSISLSAGAQVRAIAVKDGYLDSNEVTYEYGAQTEDDEKAEDDAQTEDEEETQNLVESTDKEDDAAAGAQETSSASRLPSGSIISYGGANYTVTSKNTVSYTGCSKYTETVNIPKTVKDSNGFTYKVTRIAAGAFSKSNSKIKTITIGANVKTIGAKAFSKCKALKTIKVKSGKITSVAKTCLKGCTKLKKITVKTLAEKTLFKKAVKKANLSTSVIKK